MNAPVKIEASLHSAMAAAFGEIEAATKSANNPHFKSKYADIGSVIDAIKPALIKHGLFFTQHPQPSEDGVTVETMLHHASGESLSLGSLYLPANKRDAQGFGSALTYARRYALQTAFGVPTEDDDGNAATRAVAGQSQTGAVSQQQPKTITNEQFVRLQQLIQTSGANVKTVCDYFKVETLDLLTADKFPEALDKLNSKLAQKVKAQTEAKAKEPA